MGSLLRESAIYTRSAVRCAVFVILLLSSMHGIILAAIG